jgi:hypothetical protein
MTDEERQKLIATLRHPTNWMDDFCTEAADEIERLAALAQSDAKPVAWQYRVKQGGWGGWHEAVPSREEAELCVELGRKASGGHLDDYEIRPLYTAPPRPAVRSDTRKRFDAFADALDPPRPDVSAEPVAWRVRDFSDNWILCHTREQAIMDAESGGSRIEALYTINRSKSDD